MDQISKFSPAAGLKTLFSAFSDTFTDAFLCLNFFGNEHFYLSILVDCIVHRLVYFCSRLAVNFCFYDYRNAPMLFVKRLKYRACAFLNVLRVQERAFTIRKNN